MKFPTLPFKPFTQAEWLFSAKSFVAAMLAMYIASRAGLPRPFWAVLTTYVVANPMAGNVRSKALFRFCGTLLGCTATVLIVPALSSSPELLTLTLALWVGMCLYLSLLDRTARSYIFMLAGYTAALIGFPSVDTPLALFDTAVTRVEEIGLGILCATVVHSIVFPVGLAPTLLAVLDRSIGDARRWFLDLLAPSAPVVGQAAVASSAPFAGATSSAWSSATTSATTTIEKANRAHLLADRQRLALDITQLRLLSTHVPFDTGNLRWTAGALRTMQERLAGLTPALSAAEDRLQALVDAEGRLAPDVEAVLAQSSAWLNAESAGVAADNSAAHEAALVALREALHRLGEAGSAVAVSDSASRNAFTSSAVDEGLRQAQPERDGLVVGSSEHKEAVVPPQPERDGLVVGSSEHKEAVVPPQAAPDASIVIRPVRAEPVEMASESARDGSIDTASVRIEPVEASPRRAPDASIVTPRVRTEPVEVLPPEPDTLSGRAEQETPSTLLPWNRALRIGLAVRLEELIAGWRECAALRRTIDAGLLGGPVPLHRPGLAHRAMHRDTGMALLSSLAAVLAICLCSAFWILTAWPSGSAAAMMAAVFCSFFATMDDPTPGINGFLKFTIISMPISAIFVLVLLPVVNDFAVLVLVCAPVFLILGCIAGRPATAPAGLALVFGVAGTLALHDTSSADLPSFLNSNIGQIVGISTAALVTRVVRTVGADWAAQRIRRATWKDLAGMAAAPRVGADDESYAARMLDRISLIAPRVARNDAESRSAGAEAALRDLRVGTDIVALKRVRALPAQAVNRMMNGIARLFRDRDTSGQRPGSAALLAQVDDVLGAALGDWSGSKAEQRSAVSALVGLRRNLFIAAGAEPGAPGAGSATATATPTPTGLGAGAATS